MKIFAYSLCALLFVTPAWAQEKGSRSMLELARTGGWIMIPLAAASIIAVMLILVYLISLRRSAVVSRDFMETADALLKKRDYNGLLAVANRHPEAVARITGRMLDFATRNPGAPLQSIREVAETEGGRIASALNNRIVYLADVGMLAPMLGLLGTVTGIIRSFGEMGGKSADSTRTILLAAGVGEALVATAGGLIVGIVAMAFYAYFRGRVQGLISDLEGASTHLLSTFSVNYEKKARETFRRSSSSSLLDDDEY